MPRRSPVTELRRGVAVLLSLSLVLSAAPARASITSEREIGDEFVKEARRAMPLIKDWEVNGLVSEIGNRFVKVLDPPQPFQYEFFVVSEDSINAFAVPGGKIFVHAGLIARAQNEDELAGVIGHEIAHAYAHHSVRQQEKGTVANYAALLGIFLTALNPVLGQAAIAASLGQQLKYQRDFEREADFLGMDYATKAGYQPAAMLGLLRKIYEEQKINPTAIPPYFQSHPLSGERMSYLEAKLRQTEWQVKKIPKSWRLERVQAIVRANAQTRRECVPDYERRLAEASPAEKPGALELLGTLMVHGDEYDAGRGYLEQAKAAGRQVDRELGRADLREGRLAEAEPLLLAQVTQHPDDYNALGDLGDVYFQEGNYDKAVAQLARAVELQPYIPNVERLLGRALDKQGKTGDAFYHLGHATEWDGQAMMAVGYYKRALERLDDKDPLHQKAKERIAALEKERPRLPFPPASRAGGG